MNSKFKGLILFGVIGLLIAAKAISERETKNSEVKLPPPPKPEEVKVTEFPEKLKWFNSKPLRMKELKGKKVVLLEFWRFGCPHCLQAAPQVVGLYEAYKDKGLLVIGIHAPTPGNPEENDVKLLEQKIKDMQIPFPVVQDSEQFLWNKYQAKSLPTYYLVDKKGKIERIVHADNLPTVLDGVRKLCGDLKHTHTHTEDSSPKTTRRKEKMES